MKKSPLILQSFLNSLGVFVYVSAIAWLMTHGQQLFGKLNNIWGPILFLLLFVVSASITGTLVLGRPIYLYFNEQKAAGIKLFFCTVGWLIIITLILFFILWVR